MSRRSVFTAGVLAVVLREVYVRWRREKLTFMPKGINNSRGVTMRNAVRNARPIPANSR